jgi:hypothetical protein
MGGYKTHRTCSLKRYVGHPDLPADAPLHFPHVLDPDITISKEPELTTNGIPLCDAITTFLHHPDTRSPDVLKGFYNLDHHHDVKVLYDYKSSKGSRNPVTTNAWPSRASTTWSL